MHHGAIAPGPDLRGVPCWAVAPAALRDGIPSLRHVAGRAAFAV